MILSEEQQAAIMTTESQVLIVAGAGSGKTRVVTERIKYLLSIGVTPNTIFAITYTNNAAQEMMERVGNTEVFIGTLHSLANRILKFNDIDTSKILEDKSFYKLLEIINDQDQYDSIIMPEVSHLLVDEFQDICDDEYIFIRYATQAKNLFICGDSAQAIYGFKGSNSEHFVNLANEDNTTVYELHDNYRNSINIFNFANKFLYNMRTIYRIKTKIERAEEGKVIIEDYNENIILLMIKEIGNYKDWFILARTNAQVDRILRLLSIHKIPCDTFKKSQKTFTELKETLQENSVKVLTVHSAKGLECQYAIVTGINQWNDEEKRISYVACTRPRDILVVMNNAKKKYSNPSEQAQIMTAMIKTVQNIKKNIPSAHAEQYPSDSRRYDNSGLLPSDEYQFAKAIEILTEDSYAKHFDTFNDDDVIDFENMGNMPTF